jgi:class 3 adenylate cyclase/tetratricopeptide (TPR) repeat protein
VLQVAIPYSLGGWLLVQVAEIVLDAFEAPPWVMQGILVVLVIGFPVAVVLAWIFDITPEYGVVRTGPLDEPGRSEQKQEQEEAPPAPAVSVEMGDSERRQVTILNALFEVTHEEDPELDPEHLRDFLSVLESVKQDLADRYEAYPLSSGAEELTLVFGYPQAREDDARRAVAAGQALIGKMAVPEESGSGLEAVTFDSRVGVSTGLVVVEEPKSEDRDVTIIGQAPRMASWLQSLAPPGAVIIGPHTRKLVANHFELEPSGTHPQTQFGSDITTYRVGTALSLDGAFTASQELKGRDDEMHLLFSRWESVEDAGGQFVILQGDPGIGKSSLLASFIQRVLESGDVRLIPCKCSPYERNNALAPIIQALRHSILDYSDEDSPESEFQKLQEFLEHQTVDNDEAIPLLASLLSLKTPSEFAPPSGSAQNVRMQTMELLLDLVSQDATRRPVLVVIEDLHWADPSTLEMIQMMVDRGPSQGLFVLFSSRPGLKADWVKRSYVLTQELLPLARRSARELVEGTAGSTELPSALIDRIIKETDGNPLYIQELTLAVLESDAWEESQATGKLEEMNWLEIPATLQDSLAARVDNLGEAKALLQLCSVLGHDFSYDLLRAVSGTENEAALKKELAEIVGAELLYQRGVLRNLTYSFKHIMIQETAYNSLLKSKRRELHGRAAEILEKQISKGSQPQPALLAYHFSEAGDMEKAIPYWTQASKQSLTGFANQEAVEQARRGIELLEAMPESPQRAAQEVALQSILGTALLSIHGYTDARVRKVFTRAQDLCEQIGDAPQLFQVAVGLWMYYIITAQFDEAYGLSQRLLRIAETTDNPAQHLQARYCQAFILYYRADFLTAKSHLETAIEGEVEDCDYSSQSASGDDTRIHVRVLLALINWHLGFPKTAAKQARKANAIAKKAGHPWGQTFAAFYSAWFQQMRGDAMKTLAHASEAARIAEEKGFRFWMPLVGFMCAWANNRDDSDVSKPLEVEGVEKMKAALDLYRGIGVGFGMTYLSFKLAEDYIGLGMHEPAVAELETAWNTLQTTGEDFFEPEYFRLHGRIWLARHRESGQTEQLDESDGLFRKALSSAQQKESKGLELRAANDLAEVLVLRGDSAGAASLLTGILQRFDEVDDSEDCVRASKMLKKLKK